MFSYREALNYLNSLINYEKKVDVAYNRRLFNLERIRVILERLNNPHLFLKTIHIAGTKGKGSTAAIIASILDAAGYKVGLYTSPHLISPRERIKIGTQFIKEDEFAFHLARIKQVVENTRYEGEPLSPTFFEIYTSVAFTYFYQKKVDIAVIEVGLGGRLDATNVIKPLIGIITPISFDHTEQLGSSLTSIAKEKAGIIKPGSKIVISRQEKEVIPILQDVCKRQGVKFYQVGKDIKFSLIEATPQYQKFKVDGLFKEYPSLFLPLAGEHQLWNATTAIAAVEILQEHGFKIFPHSIQQGIRKVRWPGRLQIISSRPVTLVDCAHNGASARSVAKFLKQLYPGRNIVLVMAVLKSKDINAIAEALCPLAGQVIVTQINNPRALSLDEIYTKIKRYCKSEPLKEKNIRQALEKARYIARKDGVVCITGSVYLAGEILNITGSKIIN